MGANALVIRLPPPTSHARGHLGSLLEELVERELARVGAPSPYLAAWTAMPDEANARLADQLLRAQAVGASGLAIASHRSHRMSSAFAARTSRRRRFPAHSCVSSRTSLSVDNGSPSIEKPVGIDMAGLPVTFHGIDWIGAADGV